jgi:hypothetical protein
MLSYGVRKSRSRKMVLKGTYRTHENVKTYCARRALERDYVFCLSDAGWVAWRKAMCTIKLASRSAQACRSAATDMGATMLHRDQTLQMLPAHPEWLLGLMEWAWYVLHILSLSIYMSPTHWCCYSFFGVYQDACYSCYYPSSQVCLYCLCVCVCVLLGIFLQYCFSSTSSSVLFLIRG